MRIIVIHNEIAPYRVPLFEELGKKHQVTVIFGKKKSSWRLWGISSGKNFEWSILQGIKLGDYVINMPTPKLFKKIKNSDVIIIADNVDIYPLVVFSTLFAWIAKKPILMWVGHLDTDYMLKVRKLKIIDEAIKKMLYLLADSFIVYSSKSRNFLLKREVKPHKIAPGTTQYYPQELLPKISLEGKKNLKKDWRLQVLALGYFEKMKGFEYLIRALCGIEKIKLTLAGSGRYEDALKKEAKKCKNIEFPGYVDGKIKTRIYLSSDVFVLPTLHDAWGFVVNEALYYGVPVIITKDAGASDVIINRKNGFIVEPQDSKAIRRILLHLVENRKTLKKMKVMARKTGKELVDISKGVKTVQKGIERAMELHR